jgi:hypothetical protein
MRQMHANSLDAFKSLNTGARRQAILEVYRASSCPLTDRDVGERLGFSDLNAVKPRITEAIKRGLLVECPSVPDHATKRTVRTATLAGPTQITLSFIRK